MKASILFENGFYLNTQALGSPYEGCAEIVFNTGMSGYEEIISDPSYIGQFVVFTNSYIGNTGINFEDLESNFMCAESIICKNISNFFDNYRAKISLHEFLLSQKKCTLYSIDTRYITQMTRENGNLNAIISTYDHNVESLKSKLLNYKGINNLNCVALYEEYYKINNEYIYDEKNNFVKIAVIDLGIKKSILKKLERYNCNYKTFSTNFLICDIKKYRPDAILISNGPGDPRSLLQNLDLKNKLLQLVQTYPTLGICLGHQLIGLLFGAQINKLCFGHHGINHPVLKNTSTISPNNSINHEDKCLSRAIISSQNHNYFIDKESLSSDFIVTYTHLNDFTVAGIQHKNLPIFSVQFHPESAPGTSDADFIFEDFLNLVKDKKGKN